MKLSKTVLNVLSGWGEVKENEPLGHYTTYRTGGPADALVTPRSNESLPHIVALAQENNIPLTIIGGGSNLLVGDHGIEGIVVRICEDGTRCATISILENGVLYADAMATKENLINFAINAGLGGVEFMAGIPGCVGGGIVMNAGTYMGNFVDILLDVDVINAKGMKRTIPIDKTMSSYRHMDLGDGIIITGARFRLPAGDGAGVRARVEEIRADRRKKHPLDYPSAGSVFKNPEGHSSWKLINDAGLKGRSVGGASVSDLHTNFIINVNNATSRDIRDLILLVRETVHSKFGIHLETEIKMVGLF